MEVTSGASEEPLRYTAVIPLGRDVKEEQCASQKLLKGRHEKPYCKSLLNADLIITAR